jgi:hypothetical protein
MRYGTILKASPRIVARASGGVLQKRQSPPVPALCALLLAGISLGAGSSVHAQKARDVVHPADVLELLSGDSMLNHIRVLAADSLEGRKPGTRGGELAERYIQKIFRDLGLNPGSLDNSYFQNVPLIGSRFIAEATFRVGGRDIKARIPDDVIIGRSAPGPRPLIVKASPVVFAGFGVVAPEAGRDDYKGIDVTGKTVLVLAGLPKPAPGEKALDPAANSPLARLALAYNKGAVAVLGVHDSVFVGTAYSTIARSARGERLRLAQEITPPPQGLAHIAGWMNHEFLVALLPENARDWNAIVAQATSKDFKPFALNATADIELHGVERSFTSRNIVGRLQAYPNLRDEYVIVTAHWDHLGKDTTLTGDQIFNGAIDNAGGVAQMIEIARALVMLPRPKRSVLFIATTAEEAGMLGTQYYVAHPLYPLERALAEINLDWFFPWPKTNDYFETGFGSTTLDTLLIMFAKEQGRTVSKDPWPKQGYYFRSDHLPFAQAGVPSLFGGMGTDIVGKGKAYGEKLYEQYDKHDYHAVTDSIASNWTMEGALLDAALLAAVIHSVADGTNYPGWTDDPAYAAFKSRREDTASKRKSR